MLKKLFYILFKLKGWKLIKNPPKEAYNCVMIAAPHTSNWDFVYAISALDQLGLNPRFTIKKEMNKFPIGGFIEDMGALWIDRSPKVEGQERKSMTQVMVELFKNAEKPLCMIVTAEGTRSKSAQWKTGFYYAAREAKVPICLAYMDYPSRTTGVGLCFMPSGDLEGDMRMIMDFYSNKIGKFPENFSLDERFK